MVRISLGTRTMPETPPPAGQPLRIGWLCHLIRAASAAQAAWTLALTAWWWSDAAAIEKAYGTFLKVDVSGASSLQYGIAVAINLCSWALYAAISFCIWRQFGAYLQGRVFTVDAAIRMRRINLQPARTAPRRHRARFSPSRPLRRAAVRAALGRNVRCAAGAVFPGCDRARANPLRSGRISGRPCQDRVSTAET